MSISGIPQFYIPYGCYEMKKPEAQAIQVLLLMALRHIPVWEEQQWISARSQAPIITGKKKKKKPSQSVQEKCGLQGNLF